MNIRDDFSQPIKNTLKMRAAFICSNPNCKKMTIAPSPENEEKVQYIGIAAHITAATEGGPRFDESLSKEKRKSINNAIFLCGNCSIMIDKNNGIDYKKEVLFEWKKSHDEWVLKQLNKTINTNTNVRVESFKQSGGITANIINVEKLKISEKNEGREHDRQLFIKIDDIFDEDHLNTIAQSLLADESTNRDDQNKLVEIDQFLEKSSNLFLDEKIQIEVSKFHKELKKLLKFLLYNFDMYPYKQSVANY